MFDDRSAEHIPGCNMAFWKWALDEIGGFDRFSIREAAMMSISAGGCWHAFTD